MRDLRVIGRMRLFSLFPLFFQYITITCTVGVMRVVAKLKQHIRGSLVKPQVFVLLIGPYMLSVRCNTYSKADVAYIRRFLLREFF